MRQVLVGLGGNVGGGSAVRERFERARAALARLDYVAAVRASPLYRSAPVGQVSEQPSFVNAVLELSVSDPPAPIGILADLLDIEAALGRDRRREIVSGPRSIDLDLLIVDDIVCDLPGPPALVLPHPRLCERAFVLAPLAELRGPEFVVEDGGKSVAELLADPNIASQSIELIDRDW